MARRWREGFPLFKFLVRIPNFDLTVTRHPLPKFCRLRSREVVVSGCARLAYDNAANPHCARISL